MYLISTTRDKSEMTAKPPMGAGVSQEVADQADFMELWGTSFKDPGDDFCEFILKKDNGQEVTRERVAGY
jgi:hypothetical protein